MKYFILLVIIAASFAMDKSEKELKIEACVKLSKTRLSKDSVNSFLKQENIGNLVEVLSQGFEKKEDAMNQLYSIMLLNCYNDITYFQAEDIYKMKQDSIPVKDEEYRLLLGVEKWMELFMSGDKERISHEYANLQDAINDLKSEEHLLRNLNQNNRVEQPIDNDEFYQFDRRKELDLNIFGFNFTELNIFYKYIIGIGLIALVFLSVLYGLKRINDLRNQNKKKEKKKK